MTKLIAIDDGHGSETPGKRTDVIPELGRQVKENEFNREFAKYLEIELERCGFRTIQLAPTDYDTPLRARTDLANRMKADLLISGHFNAITGKFATSKAEGFSAHVHNTTGAAADFARIALKHLSAGTPQKNRGLVKQNLHMTRESHMPAVLFEFGFMDNLREARLMLNVDFQKECAQEVALAVCEYYKVPYIPVAKPLQAVSKPDKQTDAPKKEESVQILTGGLSPEMVKEVTQFFKVKEWWAKINFTTDGENPRALTGGLSPEMRAEFEKWLKGRGWFFEVIKK
ncbi:N-acetylmuramoyl-L-alanine amidase [Metabacillus idriensis]|uniref:N-acetylmuramoyl-L-alanine amidase family protein n=1 Tax=Metabacillus idriensis TaxID=324768 RepID=UPI00203E6116|nr:N-acetylmuramoyl-L-alanine amidase [Metabacillus idriensis]MCM3598731.1 N-acetylmuramoyl-L-alanine amidase [Metabacillus idriensis]